MSICPCISTPEDLHSIFLSIQATKLHLSQTTSDGSSVGCIKASEQKQNILKTKQIKKKPVQNKPSDWLDHLVVPWEAGRLTTNVSVLLAPIIHCHG